MDPLGASQSAQRLVNALVAINSRTVGHPETDHNGVVGNSSCLVAQRLGTIQGAPWTEKRPIHRSLPVPTLHLFRQFYVVEPSDRVGRIDRVFL